ncbi:acyl carrier protein [Candidatus Woesearchaeota archaeon]|nr:acyl carrier protein [Candidatus Woesearchaeota archaeon]
MDKYIDLKEIISDALNIKKEDISPDIDNDNISEWDSLSHVSLIIKLEEKLNIKLSAKEASRIISMREILKLIKKHDVIPKSEDLQKEYGVL